MARYRRNSPEVEAIEWYPDPAYGEFIDGKYVNHKVGYDAACVEYTITEVGVQLRGGFRRLKPGDFIVVERMPTGVDVRFPWSRNDFLAKHTKIEDAT